MRRIIEIILPILILFAAVQSSFGQLGATANEIMKNNAARHPVKSYINGKTQIAITEDSYLFVYFIESDGIAHHAITYFTTKEDEIKFLKQLNDTYYKVEENSWMKTTDDGDLILIKSKQDDDYGLIFVWELQEK